MKTIQQKIDSKDITVSVEKEATIKVRTSKGGYKKEKIAGYAVGIKNDHIFLVHPFEDSWRVSHYKTGALVQRNFRTARHAINCCCYALDGFIDDMYAHKDKLFSTRISEAKKALKYVKPFLCASADLDRIESRLLYSEQSIGDRLIQGLF